MKNALALALPSLAVPPSLTLKTHTLTAKIALAAEKKASAKISLVFLGRVDAFYVQSSVYDGDLQRRTLDARFPKSASNLFCQDLYFRSSLSEKNKEFSPDQGGARYFSASSDFEAIAQDSIQRIQTLFLPALCSALLLDSELPTFLVAQRAFFSYPLALLALLQKKGFSNAYSEILSDKSKKGWFKKELALDFSPLNV